MASGRLTCATLASIAPVLARAGAVSNRIGHTASVTAYRGSPQLLDYSATKGAIVAFTRSLSETLAEKQIRVNGIYLGPVEGENLTCIHTRMRYVPQMRTVTRVQDGKAVKQVAKRLKAYRGVGGGILGGRALVALRLRMGVVVAMYVHPDVAFLGRLLSGLSAGAMKLWQNCIRFFTIDNLGFRRGCERRNYTSTITTRGTRDICWTNSGQRWEPAMDAQQRDELYTSWKRAVTKTFDWVVQ